MKYFLCALAIIIFAVPALAFEPEPGEEAVYAGQNFTDEVKILLRRAGFNI